MGHSAKAQPNKIEFWFDFASAYAYFAAQDVNTVAQNLGLQVVWRPFMLGAAFKVTGVKGLSSTPMKAEYALHDWRRIARSKDIPFSLPEGHPCVALAATRAHYWIEQHAPEIAASFALKGLNAYFQEGQDLSNPETVANIAGEFGFDRKTVLDGILDPEIKSVARRHSDGAIIRGIFGSPFFLVDEEPFWGWDRLPMIEKWVRNGGW